MPSIIEGYNYDIFISYRQKDNKGDMWVSEFVEALKTELESTFKEDISVYFDINPHDGLLETHDVDESLKEKLKCLVFIPIISRTYCDPKSFAWEHEFKAFVEQASNDQFGLKVKLPNGNVASRVLPVQIHDLDNDDITQCESVLGSVLRGIEFIYKEPGVNKPLTDDDDEKKNLNGTKYRIQINKVANAIKEIIKGLRKEPMASGIVQEESVSTSKKQTIHEKSIVVLPFINMSADPEQEYFCDGMTEEIINTLTHVESLKVIARTSSFAFKDRYEDIREIGRKLDVETIVEGSIRKAGNRIRITAQLIKVADGSHLWSEKFDREIEDIFAIQDEISLAIIDSLKIKLLGKEKEAIVKRHTENLEAYNLYLKGNYYCQMMTAEGFKKALEHFEQALQKDPNYALAYTGLATVYWYSSYWGNVPPNKAYPRAKEYTKKALELDNNLAEAHAALGFINMNYYWNWKKAEQNFIQALQLNPNAALIHIYYSMLLTATKACEKAISEAKQAQELDPLSFYINANVGMMLFYCSHFEEAAEIAQMTITMNPNFYYSHHLLGLALLCQQKSGNREAIVEIEKAVVEIEKAVDLSGGNPMEMAILATIYYRLDKKDETEKIYNSLKKRSEEEYVPPICFYMIHINRGEQDLAFEWLERACNEHDSFLPWLRISPTKSRIPDEPRYKALLRKVGLE